MTGTESKILLKPSGTAKAVAFPRPTQMHCETVSIEHFFLSYESQNDLFSPMETIYTYGRGWGTKTLTDALQCKSCESEL